MSEYPYFFSYAHNDLDVDPNVLKFFDELNRQVRAMTGSKVDGFRDEDEIRAGDAWSAKLARELRSIPAMVCLYSPSYFFSPVCGQEMQVFLERRAKFRKTQAGSPPAAIIPVLWVPETAPHSLPDLQYEKPKGTREGLAYVGKFGDQAEFKQIAWKVAVRVKEARKTPLPDFGRDLVLGGVESAFDPPPLPLQDLGAADAHTGPDCVTFVYAGVPSWDAWPFAPSSKPLLHTSAAIAKGRELATHQLTFDLSTVGLPERLATAREKNHVVICLVDGSSLHDPSLITRLREYDSYDLNACSTIVVWPAARTSAAEATVQDAFPRKGLRQPPYFYRDIEKPEQFAEAVAKSLDVLRNDALRNPRGITPLPPSSSYPTMPTVNAPGGRVA